MKQTAVEWYAEQMQLKEKFTQEEFDNITNQAKEMEKQQIIDAGNQEECFGFQVYTRELSVVERMEYYGKHFMKETESKTFDELSQIDYDKLNIPTRAISLMCNQLSADTFLSLPFSIASYGLLLEIIAKEVNMVPDELIGNLGDVHLYSNHIEQAKETPNPADFMQLGEKAFEENVHEKLRETLSPTEKQMWINGYLLALTQQNKR